MQFIKKIGDGELTIKDNEVLETSSSDKAKSWTDEFNSTHTESKAEVYRILTLI